MWLYVTIVAWHLHSCARASDWWLILAHLYKRNLTWFVWPNSPFLDRKGRIPVSLSRYSSSGHFCKNQRQESPYLHIATIELTIVILTKCFTADIRNSVPSNLTVKTLVWSTPGLLLYVGLASGFHLKRTGGGALAHKSSCSSRVEIFPHFKYLMDSTYLPLLPLWIDLSFEPRSHPCSTKLQV